MILISFVISALFAIGGGFLVKTKTERKIIKKIEKTGVKVNPEDKIYFFDFLKEE